jgi:TatA/E family protein of Tat protein translocase
MFGLTPAHLIIILVIALIVVGPGKLPEVGSAIGKSIREFQNAVGPEAITGPVVQPAPQVQPAPVYYAVPSPVAAAPVQYQPVMGDVQPAPAQLAPIAAPVPQAVQPEVTPPAAISSKAD